MAKLSSASDSNSTSLLGQRAALRGITEDLALLGGSLGSTAAMAAQLYIGNQHLLEGYGGLTGALSALLTPTNLAIGATVGLTIAGVALYESILAQEQAFSDLSVRTNTTLADLHALAAAASFQGVDTTDFLKDMTAFGTLTQEATQNMGSLAELFRANGVAAGTLEQNMANVANLVKNASSEAAKYQIVLEAGLPATRQMVDFLSQGAAAIQQAETNAVQFGGTADAQLLAKAKDFGVQWNTAWTNFKTLADNALIGFAAKLDDISHSPTLSAMLKGFVGGLPMIGPTLVGAYNASNPTTVSNPNALNTLVTPTNQMLSATAQGPTTQTSADALKNLQNVQQYVGALGQLATVDERVRAKEAELSEMYLQTGVSLGDAKQRILDYTAAAALGVIAIEQQTNAQTVQAATIGMSVGNAAAYAAVQERINAAALVGNTLTPQQIAELKLYAAALGTATQATALAKTQNDALFQTVQLGTSEIMLPTINALHQLYGDDYQAHLNDAIASQITLNTVMAQTKTIADNALNTFADDLLQGKSAADSLRDALLNVEQQLIKIATNQVLSAAFGSGLSGIFGGLFGGGTTAAAQAGTAPALDLLGAIHHAGGIVGEAGMPTRAVSASLFAGAPRFHDGGMVSGEVPIIAKKGEGVFTPEQMAALAPAGGGQPITIVNNNNFTGADPGSEARIKAYVDARSKQTVSDAVSAVRQANSAAPAYLRNGR